MQIEKRQQIKKTSSSFWQHMYCEYWQCTQKHAANYSLHNQIQKHVANTFHATKKQKHAANTHNTTKYKNVQQLLTRHILYDRPVKINKELTFQVIDDTSDK